MCSTDGYIVDIYGLFEANLNDAAILLNKLEKDSKLGECKLVYGKKKMACLLWQVGSIHTP